MGKKKEGVGGLRTSPPSERGVLLMVEPPAPAGPGDSLPRGGPDSSSQWVGFWRNGVVSSVASQATSDLKNDGVEKDGRYELVEVFGTHVTYAPKGKVLLPTASFCYDQAIVSRDADG